MGFHIFCDRTSTRVGLLKLFGPGFSDFVFLARLFHAGPQAIRRVQRIHIGEIFIQFCC